MNIGFERLISGVVSAQNVHCKKEIHKFTKKIIIVLLHHIVPSSLITAGAGENRPATIHVR